MIYGQYEYIELELDQIVVLPQVRKTKNSKIEEMADSIEDKGLINPLDVAKLTKEELLFHVKFISELWKKEIDVNKFKEIDGYYYVLIAGHTRLEALKINAKKKKREDKVSLKVHKVKTSEEILAIQLDENIHSEPKIEERAIAIIETYHIGLLNGKWSNKEEFMKQVNNKFSRRILSEALAFANLASEIQEYIFSYNIPFAIGVELGRIYPLVEMYEKDLDEILYEKNIKFHYAVLLGKLQNAKSVKQGLTSISAHAKNLNDHFRKEEDVQQETLDWFLDGVNRQDEIIRKELVDEHRAIFREITSHPFEYYIQLLSLDHKLTGLSHDNDIEDIKDLYGKHMKKDLRSNFL